MRLMTRERDDNWCDLFVTASGKNAFRISNVKYMRMKGWTHVVYTEDEKGHEAKFWISEKDADRLQRLTSARQNAENAIFQWEGGCFDISLVSAVRCRGRDDNLVCFVDAAGIKDPVILKDEDCGLLWALLDHFKEVYFVTD